MVREMKITFTGGMLLGEERTLPVESPILLGRSHSADIRLKEADVSGKHVEIRSSEAGLYATCLSRHGFQWNGLDIAEGESQRLSPGDVVSLGSRVRFRIDGISDAAAPTHDSGTLATRAAVTADGTMATQAILSGSTFATVPMGVVEDLPSDIEAAPRGSLEESPVTDSDSMSAVPRMPQQRVSSASPEMPLQPSSPAPTAVQSPAPTVVPSVVDDSPTEDDPLPSPQAAPMDFSTPPDDMPTGTDTGSGGGETVEMKTRQASMDEIFRMKRMLETKRRFRRRMVGLAFFFFVSMLGAVVFVRWPRSEKWLSNPTLPGKEEADFASYVVKSKSGNVDMEVKYPRNDQMSVQESDVGLDVSTFTGRDRDVPFRLSFVRRIEDRQLHLSLTDAASEEVKELGEKGYVFFRADDDAIMPEELDGHFFFELLYPGWCQVQTQRGTIIFRREFVRTDGAMKWHGILLVLRNGRTVYRLLREIPDSCWTRGKFLLRGVPNLALYANFLRRHWESPGDAVLLKGRRVDELIVEVRHLLDRGWVEDWSAISVRIDTLIVMTFNGTLDERKRAFSLLDEFRKAKDKEYRAIENRYFIAQKERDKAGVADTFKKCCGAFGDDSTDLRSRKVNNPKEWSPCLPGSLR